MLLIDLIMMVIFAILIRRPKGPVYTRKRPLLTTWASMVLAASVSVVSIFLNVPSGGVEENICSPIVVGRPKEHQACLLTAVLTEWRWVPDFLRRNLVVRNEDFVPDHQWEPKDEPSLRLAGRDFRYAELSESDLHRANLRKVKLQGADLTGADLQGADLRWAYLQGADLTGAKLQGAILSLANLQGADLSGARLHAIWLENAEIWITYLFSFPELTAMFDDPKDRLDAEPTALGISLNANLEMAEEAGIRQLLEKPFMKHRTAAIARLRALLDPQRWQAWKQTEDFKRWKARAGKPDEEARRLLLQQHGKTRAAILCDLPAKLRHKIAERLRFPQENLITYGARAFSDPTTQHTAAYMWKLCLREDEGPITGDADRDTAIRRRFQELAKKLLPQARTIP